MRKGEQTTFGIDFFRNNFVLWQIWQNRRNIHNVFQIVWENVINEEVQPSGNLLKVCLSLCFFFLKITMRNILKKKHQKKKLVSYIIFGQNGQRNDWILFGFWFRRLQILQKFWHKRLE